MRNSHEKPGLAKGHRGEFFAHAFGEGGAAANENRYVGTQAQAQVGQAIFVPVQLPEVVEAEQGGYWLPERLKLSGHDLQVTLVIKDWQPRQLGL